MPPVTRPAGIAAAFVAALALAGCAPLRVNSYLERDVNFARYHAYAWMERTAFSTGDPRLDNNRFFSQRIEDAVDLQLAARGFEKVRPHAADLVIQIHARVDHRRQVGDTTGTLFIDFIDTRTNRLAWRGWAEGSVDGVIDDQRWMEKVIDETVAKILARLPRHQS
jgi:hypothetical protein